MVVGEYAGGYGFPLPNPVFIHRELPLPDQIEEFAEKSVKVPGDLNFESKQAIVRSVVDKIVGTQERLQVSGFILITYLSNGALWSINGNCGVTERGEVDAL